MPGSLLENKPKANPNFRHKPRPQSIANKDPELPTPSERTHKSGYFSRFQTNCVR